MKCVKGLGFLWVAVLAAFFALSACDDSSSASSNGPDENAAAESSSSLKDSDTAEESSSSIDKKSSGNETKDKSSSGNVKSSSSVKDPKVSSSDEILSSSSSVSRRCEEGTLDTVATDTSTAYMRCLNNRWRTDSIVYVKPKVYPVMDSLFETKYSTYGEFEDPRDHQSYKTVILNMHDRDGKIVEGEKIEVFAQNLNYGEMIDTSIKIHDDTKVEKYCDLNDEWFCDNGWGGRYTWSEAMGLSAKYDSVLWKDTVGGDTRIHQGLCPEDWHIMNAYEWKNYTSTMGLPLASKVNWSPLDKAGANMSGLSVLFQMKTYKENWGNATFFLPTEEDGKKMYRVTVNDSYVTQNAAAIKHHNWFYVRCVRDY
ncbi:FISUMP domain-containing protein [Fibrobacter sp. UWH4]|uniref:FISUMP domain-containing protein n=1 Tax=Fibrobacter sp. UWH4 TaxID=1896210 RepID=UPI00091E948A|nr:FISUMP domain-containing protein [Fibrobacter sp. UWH4]SHL84540.1 major paralogous domain-containing protein [Fibrobacter sp. UWH4]